MAEYDFSKPNLFSAWANLKDQLKQQGLSVVRGTDFDVLEARLKSSEKVALTEHFKTALNTYTPANAFWVAVLDEDGSLAAVGAARLDDLQRLPLVDYWRKYWFRCYPAASDRRATMAEIQPRYGAHITGRIVYMGDLWVRREFRLSGVGSTLTQLIQIDAVDEWRPDYLYGWMRPRDVARGFWAACEFRHLQPCGITWEAAPSTIDRDLSFVGSPGYCVCDLIDRLASDSHAQSYSRTGSDNPSSS